MESVTWEKKNCIFFKLVYLYLKKAMAKYNQKFTDSIVSLIEQDLYTVSEICRITGINRKTFYEWKNSKPEFKKEIEDAMLRREDALLSMARISLRQKLEGYTQTEERVTYEPARSNPGELIEKSRVIKTKQCQADLRVIKYIMERSEKRQEKDEPEDKPWVIHVPDQHTADQLRILENNLRNGEV